MDEMEFLRELTESYSRLQCGPIDVRSRVRDRIGELRAPFRLGAATRTAKSGDIFTLEISAAAAAVILAGSGAILYGVFSLLRDLSWTGSYYALLATYF